MPGWTHRPHPAVNAGWHSPRIEHLTRIGLAAVAGGLVGILLLTVWGYEERGVRVVAVGTERGVSVLVTSGTRRVLVASGSTGDALDDGLDEHLRPLHRDLDLVLIDPGTEGADFGARGTGRRWTLGGDTVSGVERVDSSGSIALPHGVVIDLLIEPGPVGSVRGWVAAISREHAVVAIAGGTSPWVSATAASRRPGVVIAARATGEPVASTAPLLLTRASGDERPSSTEHAGTVIRLHPAQSMVLRLHDRGVELPGSVGDRLDRRAATPRTSSRPLPGTRSSNSRRISARSSSERRTSRPARAIALATRTAFR